MRARRGAVRESADGGLIIELCATDAAQAYAWLAACALGSVVTVASAEHVRSECAPPAPKMRSTCAADAPQMPKPPPQSIGMDGIDAMTAGTAQLPPKELAIIQWAAALAASARFQNWVEIKAKRDPSVDSAQHARGWILLQCGARTHFDLPKAVPHLRIIAAEYGAWYASTQPGDAFDGVPACELVA